MEPQKKKRKNIWKPECGNEWYSSNGSVFDLFLQIPFDICFMQEINPTGEI